MKKVRE